MSKWLNINSNAREISTNLKYLPVSLRPQMRKAMVRILAGLHRHLVNEKLSQGGILEPRTGNTKRAVFTRIDGPDSAPVGVVGVDTKKAPGARIHEFGGTITPKTASNLTIPLAAVLTGNKVARFTAHDVIANPHAFGYSGTFVAKHIIFGKLGGKLAEPLFLLKKSITLPAREFLKSTLDSQATWIESQFDEALSEALRPSGGA